MISVLLALALAQAGTQVLVDPRNEGRKVTTSDAGGHVGLDVFVLNPSAGGSGGSGGTSLPYINVVVDSGWISNTPTQGSGQGGPVDGGWLDGIRGPLTTYPYNANDGGVWPVSNTNIDVALSTRTKPSDQQHAIIDSSALPSGAATETTLATLLASGTFTARLGLLGQKAMTGSAPVVIASDQSALPVTLATAPITAVTNAGLSNLDVLLSTRTKPADQQHVIVDTIPSTTVTGPLTDTQLRASPLLVTSTDTAGSGQGGYVDGGFLNASGADGGSLATDATAQQQQVTLEGIRQLLLLILDQSQQQTQIQSTLH